MFPTATNRDSEDALDSSSEEEELDALEGENSMESEFVKNGVEKGKYLNVLNTWQNTQRNDVSEEEGLEEGASAWDISFTGQDSSVPDMEFIERESSASEGEHSMERIFSKLNAPRLEGTWRESDTKLSWNQEKEEIHQRDLSIRGSLTRAVDVSVISLWGREKGSSGESGTEGGEEEEIEEGSFRELKFYHQRLLSMILLLGMNPSWGKIRTNSMEMIEPCWRSASNLMLFVLIILCIVWK